MPTCTTSDYVHAHTCTHMHAHMHTGTHTHSLIHTYLPQETQYRVSTQVVGQYQAEPALCTLSAPPPQGAAAQPMNKSGNNLLQRCSPTDMLKVTEVVRLLIHSESYCWATLKIPLYRFRHGVLLLAEDYVLTNIVNNSTLLLRCYQTSTIRPGPLPQGPTGHYLHWPLLK